MPAERNHAVPAAGSAERPEGAAASEAPRARALLPLALGALGVVYGDIGTSPLYALRECFHGAYAVAPTPENVLGVLSLVVWSLIFLISVKYLLFVLRADNRGEGGILALVALLIPHSVQPQGHARTLALLGVFGAALLYGDSMITPAISVLSAAEGLEVVTPGLERFVVPATLAILIGLFAIQPRGTGRVGAVFGPIMVVWFAVMAALGAFGIRHEPAVVAALWPGYALDFFVRNGGHGFVVLAAVFLVVTGGEALYADMGHFGRRPIRLAWFSLVLPALVLNYFGQGALLLEDPAAAASPFYRLAPAWALIPLVLLATVATVVASQAVISGAFSLSHQAIQLGYSPRLAVSHTSAEESGQIYVAPVNWALMLAACALVVGFGSSTNLAAAYGMAVTANMVLTTLLLTAVARQRWGWGLASFGLTAAFLPLDLAFLGSNLLKITHGGWISLAIAALGFTLMSTWKRGRWVLQDRLEETSIPLELFLPDLDTAKLPRAPHCGVFLTGDPRGTPHALLHNVKHNQVVHSPTILLTVLTADVPVVAEAERVTVQPIQPGFFRVIARYGFMEVPNVPEILQRIRSPELRLEPMRTSYFVGREKLIPRGSSGMGRWRERLFALMAGNAEAPTAWFRIPANQVVELGAQVEL